MAKQSEPSRRPYLLRAMHEWISDCGYSAHIVVNAAADGVLVPDKFVENGKIVLNIDSHAVTNLSLGKDNIEFDAQFEGKHWHVSLPVSAVQGVYAKETGVGMIFNDDDESDPPGPGGPDKGKPGEPPQLKIVR